MSIAGINLEDGLHDVREHVQEASGLDEAQVEALIRGETWRAACRNLSEHLGNHHAWVQDFLTPPAPAAWTLNVRTLFPRMQQVWHTALAAMRRQGVEYAVLSAIGCGAFRGPFAEVPALWAAALRCVLEAAGPSDGLPPHVVVCFPPFPADGYNYCCFVRAFSGHRTGVPVELRRGVGMLEVAVWLRQRGCSVGLLNPSDVLAVRKGHIGMFFDGGGHLALEEILAVSTTALTMNRQLNPRLWDDGGRWVALTPPTATWSSAPPPHIPIQAPPDDGYCSDVSVASSLAER